MKKIFIIALLLSVLVGCQNEKTPDMKPPKGGSVEYYYDEGGEISYGSYLPPRVGPYNKPDKNLEMKCNSFVVKVKDENGEVVRFIHRDKINDEWFVSEINEDGGVKKNCYDGEMKFLSADVYYYNEQNKVVKRLALNEDGSIAFTEINVYLEDGTTRFQEFMYNEKGELTWWCEYPGPEHNEFVERDVKEAPAEYVTYK